MALSRDDLSFDQIVIDSERLVELGLNLLERDRGVIREAHLFEFSNSEQSRAEGPNWSLPIFANFSTTPVGRRPKPPSSRTLCRRLQAWQLGFQLERSSLRCGAFLMLIL